VAYAQMRYGVRQCLGVATEPIGNGRSYDLFVPRTAPPQALFNHYFIFDNQLIFFAFVFWFESCCRRFQERGAGRAAPQSYRGRLASGQRRHAVAAYRGQEDHMTGCDWRVIRLGGVAGCTGDIGTYANIRPNVSSLSRACHQGVEPGNNLLSALAKDDVFAGRTRL
jgi:hypothetical protein